MASAAPPTAAAPAAAPSRDLPHDYWGHTVVAHNEKPHRHRRGYIPTIVASVLFALGTALWIAGSALLLSAQRRFFVNPLSPFNPSPFSSFDSGDNFRSGYILLIIGSALWLLASIPHLLGTLAEVTELRASLRPGVRMPVLGPFAIMASWLQCLGILLVLIGSCLFAGSDLGSATAGAILWLIGFALWEVAVFTFAAIALIVVSVSSLMPDMLQRRRSWHGLISALGNMVSIVFFCLGSILWITALPPGIWHIAALLFLMASIFKWLGDIFGIWSNAGHYIPVLGFVMAGPHAAGHHGVGTGVGTAPAAVAAVPAGGHKPIDGNAYAQMEPRAAASATTAAGYGAAGGGPSGGGGGADSVVVHTAN